MKLMTTALALALFAADAVHAGCGVDMCPDPRVGRAADLRTSVDVTFRSAGFAVPGGAGDYDQAIVRATHRLAAWTVGAALPLQFLRADASRAGGVGNSILFAERQALGILAAGVQVELPGMKSSRGLSSNHTELLPYASLSSSVGAWLLSARSGLRFSVSSDHHEGAAPQAATPLLVEPHGKRELVYRAGVGYLRRAEGPWPELYLLGQHSFDGTDSGTGFLSAGLAIERSLSRGIFVRPFVELPLTSPRRVNHRAGAAAGLRF